MTKTKITISVGETALIIDPMGIKIQGIQVKVLSDLQYSKQTVQLDLNAQALSKIQASLNQQQV